MITTTTTTTTATTTTAAAAAAAANTTTTLSHVSHNVRAIGFLAPGLSLVPHVGAV